MTPRTRLALQKLLPHSPQTCEEIERIVRQEVNAALERAVDVVALCCFVERDLGSKDCQWMIDAIRSLKHPAPRRARKAKR